MQIFHRILIDENTVLNAECIERMSYHEDEELKFIRIRTASGENISVVAEGTILQLWKMWKERAFPVKRLPTGNIGQDVIDALNDRR
jgi:hypothetical protein